MKDYKAIALGGILAGALAVSPALANPHVSSDPNGVQFWDDQAGDQVSDGQMDLEEQYGQLAEDQQKLSDDMAQSASEDQLAIDRDAIAADEETIRDMLMALNGGILPDEVQTGFDGNNG